jgi:hypothetical protein
MSGFVGAPILGQPKLEGGAVTVSVRFLRSTLWVRFRARDPVALFDAINAMR